MFAPWIAKLYSMKAQTQASQPILELAQALDREKTRLLKERERLTNRVNQLVDKLRTELGEIQRIDVDLTAIGFIPEKVKINLPSMFTPPIRNEKTLKDVLVEVVPRGRTFTVKEATEAVLKTNYRSTSKRLSTLVNQALIDHKNLFEHKHKGVGEYQFIGSGKGSAGH